MNSARTKVCLPFHLYLICFGADLLFPDLGKKGTGTSHAICTKEKCPHVRFGADLLFPNLGKKGTGTSHAICTKYDSLQDLTRKMSSCPTGNFILSKDYNVKIIHNLAKYEPTHQKTCNLQMRKQRRRSTVQ